MTENRLNHKLDTTKLKTIKDVRNVFDTMELVASFGEDNELYELAKEYFTIPYKHPELLGFNIPRKTLEEIEQELDENIDKLIEDTKRNFYGSKIYADSKYERAFDKIFDNFEYAKEHGQFPVKLTIGNLDCSTLGVSSAVEWTTEFRIGKDEVGYWDIKPNIKMYLKKKPNRIVRYFTKLLLDFTWKDK